MSLPKTWKRWTASSLAAPALLSMFGCASPRGSVTGPLADRTASPLLANGVADARERAAPRNPATLDQSARLASSRRARAAQPPAELERSLARFVARPAELFNPPTPIRRWQYIVLHHSGTDTGGFASIDRFHREKNHWDECGYHFVIGNGTESGDGEIEVGTRWLKQKHGAHCKNTDHPEYNDDGIGICLVGNCNQSQPTPKQIEASRRLVAYLTQRCGVPADHVTTHGDLAGKPTECPGSKFPLDRIISGPAFASRLN